MALLHRKNLGKPDNISDHESCPPLPAMLLPLPRPTLLAPPPPSLNQSPSPLMIIMFGGLAVTFSFICYLICVTRYLRRPTNHANTDHESREDFVNEDLGPMIHNPIWLINTIGLDQSQIESIQVFKYKSDEKLIEGTDCSVCLSEFEDDESLRLLPKCSHAFHVLCIDTWLRSHKNCPLCRAPIINSTNDQVENVTESSTSETIETPVNESSTSETIDDHDHDHDQHVVEVENNEEIVKNDHHHVQGEELVAIRRSFSSGQFVALKKPNSMKNLNEHKLKGSSSSIHICGKVTKSYSIGRSQRKASSFTSKCRPYNQSY